MPEIDRLVLFVVDGLRPDGLKEAATPQIDALRNRSIHTGAARTVMPSSTLPCHTSMFRSVPPERHGITTNTWVPQVRPVPSITDVLHRAGKRTAALYNWEQLRDLSDPGSLDFSCFIRNCDYPAGDLEIAARAVDWLGRGETDFAFVYFGYTDIAGHNHGWMSPPYLEAIGNVDRAIGKVAAKVDDGRTAMIVTSDHGGHARTHGTEMPEDITIPWLLCYPGVRPGEIAGAVSIIDNAPTIAALLAVEAAPDWAGRAILTS